MSGFLNREHRLSGPVAVILAAGKGVRMKSELPKVLHGAAGKPLLHWVIDAVRRAGVKRILVVVGVGAGLIRQKFSNAGVEFVHQEEQRGTAHAVLQTRSLVARESGAVLVVSGDAPLITGATLRRALQAWRESGSACTVITASLDEPAGYGRIIRDRQGNVIRIVEEKDADDEERRVKEVNSGNYVFQARALFEALSEVKPNNAQKEYYLTDTVEILSAKGKKVTTVAASEPIEILGVNTLQELARVEALLRQRRATDLEGV